MAKDRKIRYQQKLSHKEQYGGGTGYEREFLRNPESGPLTTNRLFGELDSLEYFVPSRLKYYRNRLQKAMKAYQEDLAKINSGLASYVNSAVYKTRELALLTQSILRAFDNCLLENYAHSPAEVQQAIPKDYFDNTDWMYDFGFNENELISIAGILHYQRSADKITMAALQAWWRHMLRKDSEHAPEFEQVMVWQGVNHGAYYQELQNRPDKLSAYTGLNDFPYFESGILSSYTTSYDVANKFMSGTLNSKGQRRLILNGNPDLVSSRIFSSWFVSPQFIDGQYEILCLPNIFTLLTNWEYNNEVAAGLKLEKPSERY